MMQMSIKLPMPIIDRKNVRLWREQLYAYRKRKDYWHIALMHFYLNDLGVKTNITNSDKKLMLLGLKMCQAGKKSQYLVGVCGFHYVLRYLGIKTNIRKNDIHIMIGELGEARRKRDGEYLGWYLYILRNLKINVKISKKDKVLMLQQLKRYRSNENSISLMAKAKGIAEMHFLMKELGITVKVIDTDILKIKQFQKNWKLLGLEKIRLISAETNWYLKKLGQVDKVVS
jgi:hypothetical protein